MWLKDLVIVLVMCMLNYTTALDDKPHILFIVVDDWGWADVGYHNPNVSTPTLDRLAAEGVKLENYYVASICTPSRSALMSGKYQVGTFRTIQMSFQPFNIY